MSEEKKILKEPEQICLAVLEIEGLVKQLVEIDEDYKYADWTHAEFVEGLEEDEDAMILLHDGNQIAEYGDDNYFVNQWTGYAPDDYHGYMYFRTNRSGVYVKVYYEM